MYITMARPVLFSSMNIRISVTVTLLSLLSVMSVFKGGYTAPVNPLQAFIGDSTQRFLMQYGYLPMSDMEMGNLRTHTELVDAVKRLQTFGHVPITGVVDEATKELMKRPRCSLPDILPEEAEEMARRRVKRYVKQGSTWDKTHLTWGLVNYPTGSIEGRAVEQQLEVAAKLWSDPSRLTFSRLTQQPGKADIVVQFNRGYHGDGYPFDGNGKTLAHAFYPGSGIGGDIHFDADENWVTHADSVNNSYEDISLFLTAGHELGHALGLYHSQVQNSIMSPYLNIHVPLTFTLPPDDVAAIQDLYGVNEHYNSTGEELPTPSIPETPNEVIPVEPTYDPLPTHTPNECDTKYDAISVIRRGIYVFRGKYFWRMDEGRTKTYDPVEISHFWYCLPSNITHIDAAYEKPTGNSIVFFSGRNYYICSGNDQLTESGPLRKLGLPDSLQKIDAAFVWGHNTRTYFMANTMYWKFDESINHVELDYPRDMKMWRGVPYGSIDAAFKYNGTTYFFKGKQFWEFDDLRMKVRPKSPLLSAPFWMGCPENLANNPNPGSMSTSACSGASASALVLFLALLVSHLSASR